MKTKTHEHTLGPRTSDCLACSAKWYGANYCGVALCSFHAAAPELLEAAKEALYLLKSLTGDAEAGTDCAKGKKLLCNAIARAVKP